MRRRTRRRGGEEEGKEGKEEEEEEEIPCISAKRSCDDDCKSILLFFPSSFLPFLFLFSQFFPTNAQVE